MKIRNINGMSQNICRCGSWLENWEKFSNQQIPIYCPEEECINKDLAGAHVQKDDPKEKNWYIYPLCGMHNAVKGKSLEVSIAYKLVPANASETCG